MYLFLKKKKKKKKFGHVSSLKSVGQLEPFNCDQIVEI